MKIASIIDAIRDRRARSFDLQFRLIHTGQHYDRNMSGSFFEELGIPEPDLNLSVGSGTAAEQTAGIMIRYEKVTADRRSDLCLVVGDVTSTMACAIVAQKSGVPVAHVEAGIRSGDWSMPEEINRLLTDAITNYFFTTSEAANDNLRRGGVREADILFVGNTMIDTLLKYRSHFREPAIWKSAGLHQSDFLVLTLHRPSNVDDPATLKGLIGKISESARGKSIIFPVHPRTASRLERIGPLPVNLHVTDPLGYLEFNFLVERCQAVITDSGGITEETTVLGVPCLTLRNTTERPETITFGTNVLIGTDPAQIGPHFERLFEGKWKQGSIPPLWDGHAGKRIVSHLERLLTA